MEDINDSHVGYWTEMIQASNPPIENCPYSAYMDLYQLKKHVIAFNATKIKEIVGFKLRRPQITQENLREIIDKLKAEGYRYIEWNGRYVFKYCMQILH